LFAAPVEVQVRTALSGRLQAPEKPLVKEIPEGATGVKNRFLKTFVMVESFFTGRENDELGERDTNGIVSIHVRRERSRAGCGR
jgi:hypothetical protein